MSLRCPVAKLKPQYRQNVMYYYITQKCDDEIRLAIWYVLRCIAHRIQIRTICIYYAHQIKSN